MARTFGREARAFGAAAAILAGALLWPQAGHTAAGTEAFTALQCNSCHTIPEVAPAARTDSCAVCHAWVKGVQANPAAREKAMQIFPKWERYERNTTTYFAVPDLGLARARLDPAWVAHYLADPYDVRPAMAETMVRLGPSADLEALTTWFTAGAVPVPRSPTPSQANVSEGKRLFDERACGACHTFGGLHPGPGIPAAPDLQHARDRMTDDALVAWIQQPSMFGVSAMPDLGLSTPEAVALRDYIVLADPKAIAAGITAWNGASPVAEPRWADVEERVFGRICVHCHMDPAQNEGRAGPGNAGGFGWAPSGLELQNYTSVRDNRDRILAAIRRRAEEAARDDVSPGERPAEVARPEMPGMPLGLPPIPAEDLAMVELWYRRGAPM